MKDLRCADCGNPATHEVLPRRLRRRYICAMGASLLPRDQRRPLTRADFGLPMVTERKAANA